MKEKCIKKKQQTKTEKSKEETEAIVNGWELNHIVVHLG